MLEFLYPAKIKQEDGFFTVTFRDIPFALTDGKTYTEALHEAVDCLGEALSSCIVDNEDIPMPSPARDGETLITPPPLVAAKTALYIVSREAGLSKTALAMKLGVSETVGCRLLNPRYQTKIVNIDKALALMGKRMVIGLA
jgi:antitoxin HicB